MKANELRIGSRLNVDKRGNIGEVLSIWKSKYEMVCTVRYDDPDNKLISGFKTESISELKPIQITSQVLERFGFIWLINYKAYSCFGVIIIEDTDGYYRMCDIDITVRFQYLHQLQNLIFALTGKELEKK